MDVPPSMTCDAFLGSRIYIRQPAKGFRSGMDAVFLAAACPAQPGDHVLEAGCGAGAASLCLFARVPGLKITGVEVNPELAWLAKKNAEENGAEPFEAIIADVTSGWSSLKAKGLKEEAFDHVLANPPYYYQGEGKPAKNLDIASARAMERGSLDAWLRFLAAATRPAGSCTVIYTASELPQLLEAFTGRFGGLRVIPLYPMAEASAIRVIVRGTKGSRAPLTLERGIVLHDDGGGPSAAADAILREGKPLL